jgi:predicted aldo/keto reductase-like oxidoreductase
MRLPTLGSRETVDEPEAIRMIRHAIDQGVNYVDTAYNYHGGNSERVVGRALRDGYRGRVRLATKLPVVQVTSGEDFDRFLNEQLARLGVETIDYYLFHGLRQPRWETVKRCGLLERADRALADGRIRHLGFSFHDSLDLFKEILGSYDRWTLCQIQYNFMNEDFQAGTAGLRYAAERGLAVVVMEPLLGGRLVNPPTAVQACWDAAPVRRTPAEWALDWVWNQP